MIRRPPRSTLVERRRQRQMCIRDRLRVRLGSVKCYFPKRLNNSNNWGNKLMDNFYDAAERNDYLTACIDQLVNKNVQITMLEKQPHFRWIDLKGPDFTLSIYPDGGIANGWKLRYNDSQKKYDDVNYHENLMLFNVNTHVGIQYIIAVSYTHLRAHETN